MTLAGLQQPTGESVQANVGVCCVPLLVAHFNLPLTLLGAFWLCVMECCLSSLSPLI